MQLKNWNTCIEKGVEMNGNLSYNISLVFLRNCLEKYTTLGFLYLFKVYYYNKENEYRFGWYMYVNTEVTNTVKTGS